MLSKWRTAVSMVLAVVHCGLCSICELLMMCFFMLPHGQQLSANVAHWRLYITFVDALICSLLMPSIPRFAHSLLLPHFQSQLALWENETTPPMRSRAPL